MITDGSEIRLSINAGSDRVQAMTLCVRAFFRSMHTEEFSRLIEESRISGQEKIVENLYSAGVIANIVKSILGRIDRGHYIGDQIDDYIQDATVVLMQIARQGRLDLTKSAGEIASYICLWIEQRVKRVARKDQRWRFSLSDSPGGIENAFDVTDDFELCSENVPPDDPGGAGMIAEDRFVDAPPVPWARAGFDNAGRYDFRKSERNILSIFGSGSVGEKI